MSRIRLLGVPIDAVTLEEAVLMIRALLASSSAGYHVMTPNSEMLVEASRNPSFRDLLNRTVLNLPDSAGLLPMARWTGQHLPERVAGVDTVTLLLTTLDEQHPVFLLGGVPGIAERAADILRAKNPRLQIVGTDGGSSDDTDAQRIIIKINAAKPHLLLVAFGAPKQDVWIDHHLQKMLSVRVAMGVGGTLDFIAGTQKRAPKIFQSIGCEWLWRLIREPKRWKRIVNAVIVCPLLVLRYGRDM